MLAASLDVLCDFVIKSWEKVILETVIKSFKKCGVSKAMDGTKQDLLWDADDEVEPFSYLPYKTTHDFGFFL
jgi:hypothetical protein